MTSARVISVNVGRGKDAAWAGRLRRTAIDKRPVAGPAEVGWLGLAGDEQSDTENHGGRGALAAGPRIADGPTQGSRALSRGRQAPGT